MKRMILPAAMMVFLSAFTLSAAGDRVLIKFGPGLEIGKFGELTDAELVGDVVPGIDLAVRCTDRIEICGSYRFSKTKTRMGHGYDRLFRFDAFAAGLRYKPLQFQYGEPFIGVGMNYYHFVDDSFTPFVLPVNSAVGPYIQGGSYFHFNRLVEFQACIQYSLIKHTEKRSTDYGTYHYRTDFSGLGFVMGVLFRIHGK